MEDSNDTSSHTQFGNLPPDPAAVLAAACSLKAVWIDRVDLETRLHLGKRLPGVDAVMRETLGIAIRFEDWACRHVDFAELGEVWPYLLEAEFGEACKAVLEGVDPSSFDEAHCLSVARFLGLPLRPSHPTGRAATP